MATTSSDITPDASTVSFRLTENDFEKFAFYHQWLSPKRLWYRIFMYGLIVVVMGIFGYVQFGAHMFRFEGFIIVTVSIGMIWLVPRMIRMGIVTNLSRYLRKHAPHIFEFTTVKITPEGIDITAHPNHQTISWQKVMQIIHYNNMIFIYFGTRAALIIPSGAFDSQQHSLAFYELCTQMRQTPQHNEKQ